MSAITRDQIAAWLGQVHADREVNARGFKLAFDLTQVADAAGCIPAKAVARLIRGEPDAQPPIAELVEQLVARAHLEAEVVAQGQRGRRHRRELSHLQSELPLEPVVGSGRRRSAGGYRIALWGTWRPSAARDREPARPALFPPARRQDLVRRLAEQMAARTQAAGDAHLRQQLEYQLRVLRRKGIADDISRRELRRLEYAVRAELCRLVITR